ncbi:hypothetical protein OF83DRAFT_1175123 [Amylostereum chailletii]|nr:hypothetical protein OF83DRAFT_1175123 [Amylostereum chailletii]
MENTTSRLPSELWIRIVNIATEIPRLKSSYSDAEFEIPTTPAPPSIRDVQSSIFTRASLRRVNRWFKALITAYHPADVVFISTRNMRKIQRDIDLSKTSATSDNAFLVPSSVRHMILEIDGNRGEMRETTYLETFISIVPDFSTLSSLTVLQAHPSLHIPVEEILPRIRTFPPSIRKLDISVSPLDGHIIFICLMSVATNIETLVVRGGFYFLPDPSLVNMSADGRDYRGPYVLKSSSPPNLSVDGPVIFYRDMDAVLHRLRLHIIPSTVSSWNAFVERGAPSLTHLCVTMYDTDGVDAIFPGQRLPNLTHFALRCLPEIMMRTLRRPLPPKLEYLTLSIVEHPPPSVVAIPAETRHATTTKIMGVLAAMMQPPTGKLKTIRLASNEITSIVRARVRAATDGVLSLRSGYLSETECTVDDAPGWCLRLRLQRRTDARCLAHV